MSAMSSPRSLDRRAALRLFGAAGLGLAAAACAGPGGGSGATSSASPTALATSGTPEGTVSFAHWRAEDKAVIADLIKGFVKKHPDAGCRAGHRPLRRLPVDRPAPHPGLEDR